MEKIKTKATRLADFFMEHADIYHTNKQLLKALNFEEPKFADAEIRKYTKELRSIGYPIVSNHNGYMYSENPKLIKECINRIRSQAHEMLVTANDLEKTLPAEEKDEELLDTDLE